MMTSRTHKWVIASTLALMLPACGATEGDAVRELESDGYTNVKITGNKDGAFEFSADKDEGKKCTGTITIKKSIGSSNKVVSAMCR